MRIEYVAAKRDATSEQRGLDMAEAGLVFSGPTLTAEDDRKDYGEPRYLTIGLLRGRMVVMAWTYRGSVYRIISMRKANEREIGKYGPAFAV